MNVNGQITYVIRNAHTNQMINCYEGEDGKKRAEELVEAHNKFTPNNLWKVCKEVI